MHSISFLPLLITVCSAYLDSTQVTPNKNCTTKDGCIELYLVNELLGLGATFKHTWEVISIPGVFDKLDGNNKNPFYHLSNFTTRNIKISYGQSNFRVGTTSNLNGATFNFRVSEMNLVVDGDFMLSGTIENQNVHREGTFTGALIVADDTTVTYSVDVNGYLGVTTNSSSWSAGISNLVFNTVPLAEDALYNMTTLATQYQIVMTYAGQFPNTKDLPRDVFTREIAKVVLNFVQTSFKKMKLLDITMGRFLNASNSGTTSTTTPSTTNAPTMTTNKSTVNTTPVNSPISTTLFSTTTMSPSQTTTSRTETFTSSQYSGSTQSPSSLSTLRPTTDANSELQTKNSSIISGNLSNPYINIIINQYLYK